MRSVLRPANRWARCRPIALWRSEMVSRRRSATSIGWKGCPERCKQSACHQAKTAQAGEIRLPYSSNSPIESSVANYANPSLSAGESAEEASIKARSQTEPPPAAPTPPSDVSNFAASAPTVKAELAAEEPAPPTRLRQAVILFLHLFGARQCLSNPRSAIRDPRSSNPL